jgi:7,8-dihydropterin-6-yl-methyl-4-(beta-D-ribofuranosyl)aminobenzene 5'-phosphate synthase
MRITTISENTAGRVGVLAEWGLSVLVETGDKSLLMDTGAGISAAENLEKMNIDTSKIDKIVLSHGHFDHTGGLQLLLGKLQREIEIIAHPDIFAQKYNHKEGRKDTYIGIPYSREELESLGARFTLSRGPVQVRENIWTTGEVPMVTDFEKIDTAFCIKTETGWEPDTFTDDMALAIKAPGGLVVILGCAHRGMINTLYHARNITGVQKVQMVLGGSHLKDSSDEDVWQAVSALNEMGVKTLGLSHCTGMPATMILAQTYGKDFLFNYTGNMIKIGE